MNERLIMSEEECRKKIKELLQIPKEDLLTKYMFQEQEIERLNNIINEIEAIVYADISNIDCRISIQEKLDKLKELKESGNNE